MESCRVCNDKADLLQARVTPVWLMAEMPGGDGPAVVDATVAYGHAVMEGEVASPLRALLSCCPRCERWARESDAAAERYVRPAINGGPMILNATVARWVAKTLLFLDASTSVGPRVARAETIRDIRHAHMAGRCWLWVGRRAHDAPLATAPRWNTFRGHEILPVDGGRVKRMHYGQGSLVLGDLLIVGWFTYPDDRLRRHDLSGDLAELYPLGSGTAPVPALDINDYCDMLAQFVMPPIAEVRQRVPGRTGWN